MIQMEYIVDKDKSLLTIIFDRHVLQHLRAKCDDNVILFQSNFNMNYFTLIKSDTGYRIKKVPNMSKLYQIHINHKIRFIDQFDLMDCSYFLKKNGSITIILNLLFGSINKKLLQAQPPIKPIIGSHA